MATRANDGSSEHSASLAGELADDLAWRTFVQNARNQGPWPLTDQHWQVVRFVLAYVKENDDGPALRRIARATGLHSRALYALFPFGVVRTILDLAELPFPADMVECAAIVGDDGSGSGN